MSGGAFNYAQDRFPEIYKKIEEVIRNNGIAKPLEEVKGYFPLVTENEYKCDYEYSEEVIEKLKEGIEIIKKAEIYTRRIDWLLSGDDGEESFLRRLNEELQ
jgi:hypothetical protein